MLSMVAPPVVAQGQIGSQFGGSGIGYWLWQFVLVVFGPGFLCLSAYGILEAAFRSGLHAVERRRRRRASLIGFALSGLVTVVLFNPPVVERILRSVASVF